MSFRWNSHIFASRHQHRHPFPAISVFVAEDSARQSGAGRALLFKRRNTGARRRPLLAKHSPPMLLAHFVGDAFSREPN
jgi:hypothetical protein